VFDAIGLIRDPRAMYSRSRSGDGRSAGVADLQRRRARQDSNL
jgi:hypothetical protein